MKTGLRIDVDTYRGTQLGVPNLCRLLAEHSITATFFFSVGPDNMGRHLWRLLRPAFLWKMLRTKAAKLYGWDILLRGTFWPGPLIGKKLSSVIRDTAQAGHEIGLHTWDHHAWQAQIDTWDRQDIHRSLKKGFEQLTQILGKAPTCSAVPGWKCNDRVLVEKEKWGFHYNSDCRGDTMFYPLVNGNTLSQPQIPVTLPTYDEAMGHHGITENNYNEYLLSFLLPDRLNVLTIHAEVEGIACLNLFKDFLKQAQERGISLVPLGNLLPESAGIGKAALVPGLIPGREGWVACQTGLSQSGRN